MALEVAKRTLALLNETNIEANIIFEIENDAFPEVFGYVSVTRALQIGDFDIGDGSKIGGTIVDPNSKPWIQQKGTTNNITQKVDIEKDGSSSQQSFKINLIDKDNFLTNIFSPGVRVPDILSQPCTVYWAATGAAHPKESVPIFRGVITSITYGAGNVALVIDSPEELKRQELLPLFTTTTTASITDSDTTIPLDSLVGLFESQDALTTHIRIEDETMEVTSINVSDVTVVRGSFGTIAAPHDDGSDVQSVYQLEGKPIPLALKMMLSGGGSFGDSTATRINQVSDSQFIQNGILFKDINFQENKGLSVGDLVTLTGATNAANNITERAISEFTVIDTGTVVRIEGSDMISESGSFDVTFKSQYDVLNFGCEIDPFHVDVSRFLELENLLSSGHHDMDFHITDTINADEFITGELLFPNGMFSLFRKGRISAGANLPPLVSLGTKTVNGDSVKDAIKIKVMRSTKKFFYNAVAYKYEESVLEDEKYLRGRITQSSDSTTRIPVGNKVLTIESKGIRDTPVTNNLLDVSATRLLDRYKFGAESFPISLNFKTGFEIEAGDSIIADLSDLLVSDSSTASRDFSTRVLEVNNIKRNFKTGSIELLAIDSNYQSNARYGTVSPASFIGSGSTTTRIVIKPSFGTTESETESKKWEEYVLQRIQVRSQDYTFQETVTITAIDPANPNVLVVTPALSVAPSEDYIIECPNYDETAQKTDRYWKAIHTWPTARVDVVSGASNTEFDVSAGDIGKFIEGLPIRVNNADYTDNSEVNVVSVLGTTVTCEELGFTPDSTYEVDVAHFGDSGFGYRVT